MLSDILNQASSLTASCQYHCGDGNTALVAAAAALRERQTVIFSGMGSSHFATIPASYHLAANGVNANSIEASELLHYVSPMCAGATVVLVSRSGETVEIARLLPLLRNAGALIVGVTNEPASLVARESDHVLHIRSWSDHAVAVQTYTATVQLLLAAAADGLFSWPETGRITETVASLQEQSNSWRDFLTSTSTMYLLARGPSVASALEGSLLFHEMAKCPAVGVSAGFFRHGPVEVVDEKFRGIVFAADPVTRDLNLALASDLASCGGRIAVVGPDAAPGCSHWHIPETEALLVPLFEILPVQMAALRLAEWRGIPLGSFRIASAVTLAENGFARLGN